MRTFTFSSPCGVLHAHRKMFVNTSVQKMYKKYDYSPTQKFANRSFFVSKKANEKFAKKYELFANSIVYHERPERIAHGCSFE